MGIFANQLLLLETIFCVRRFEQHNECKTNCSIGIRYKWPLQYCLLANNVNYDNWFWCVHCFFAVRKRSDKSFTHLIWSNVLNIYWRTLKSFLVSFEQDNLQSIAFYAYHYFYLIKKCNTWVIWVYWIKRITMYVDEA